jgi:hypothetical protein
MTSTWASTSTTPEAASAVSSSKYWAQAARPPGAGIRARSGKRRWPILRSSARIRSGSPTDRGRSGRPPPGWSREKSRPPGPVSRATRPAWPPSPPPRRPPARGCVGPHHLGREPRQVSRGGLVLPEASQHALRFVAAVEMFGETEFGHSSGGGRLDVGLDQAGRVFPWEGPSGSPRADVGMEVQVIVGHHQRHASTTERSSAGHRVGEGIPGRRRDCSLRFEFGGGEGHRVGDGTQRALRGRRPRP